MWRITNSDADANCDADSNSDANRDADANSDTDTDANADTASCCADQSDSDRSVSQSDQPGVG